MAGLQPGEKVPRTGTYKCIWCGPDGLGAKGIRMAMASMGLPYSPFASAQRDTPYVFFNEGEAFPSCPNCKHDPSGADPTGWEFVSQEKVTGPGAGPQAASKQDGAKAKSKGCFIATACCGSQEAPQVVCLRQYRDVCLMPHALGRAAINLYYGVSPTIAAWIQRSPRLKAAIRRVLVDPVSRWARAQLPKERTGDRADSRESK